MTIESARKRRVRTLSDNDQRDGTGPGLRACVQPSIDRLPKTDAQKGVEQ